uniref:Uncharacterized protein n=1 Tax=Molossus molossus TaxID=27622 RepID=A0A7J8BKR2_MOLMO|nr:hypothetical protein HJG59_010184 [Molossus molossus]
MTKRQRTGFRKPGRNGERVTAGRFRCRRKRRSAGAAATGSFGGEWAPAQFSGRRAGRVGLPAPAQEDGHQLPVCGWTLRRPGRDPFWTDSIDVPALVSGRTWMARRVVMTVDAQSPRAPHRERGWPRGPRRLAARSAAEGCGALEGTPREHTLKVWGGPRRGEASVAAGRHGSRHVASRRFPLEKTVSRCCHTSQDLQEPIKDIMK